MLGFKFREPNECRRCSTSYNGLGAPKPTADGALASKGEASLLTEQKYI